jgi:uncharacterized membrane protein
MIRFTIVIIIILVILIILRSRSEKIRDISKKNYRLIIISVLVLGLLILIATSGRFLLPQILQLIKIGIPLLTKFIGI